MRHNMHERGDVSIYSCAPDFIEARYTYGNVIRAHLSLSKESEKELALLLAMAVQEGILDPIKLQACMKLAESHAKDRKQSLDPIIEAAKNIKP